MNKWKLVVQELLNTLRKCNRCHLPATKNLEALDYQYYMCDSHAEEFLEKCGNFPGGLEVPLVGEMSYADVVREGQKLLEEGQDV